MDHLDPPVSPNNTSVENPGRRELLKALAAGGGAIAASSLLPGQWVKPVIEAGHLPAHAQASPPVEPTLEPTVEPTQEPDPPAISSCGAVSSFSGSSTEVLFDDDERLINLFATISPPPPVGTLIRFDVSVNGSPIAIDDSPPYTIGTDAAGLADFNLATPFPLTVRPVLPNIGAGFDELTVGDIVTITFSFEPPADPTFDPTPCRANFTVVPPL